MSKFVVFLFVAVGFLASAANARYKPRVKKQFQPPPACFMQAMQCMEGLKAEYENKTPDEILEKLLSVHLREICAPVMEAGECADQAIMEGCSAEELASFQSSPYFAQLAQTGAIGESVCVDQVDVFNEHKACLLRTRPGGRPGAIELGYSLEACSRQVTMNAGTTCMPPELFDCAADVVAAQCGDEAGAAVRLVGNRVGEVCDELGGGRWQRELYELVKKTLAL